VPTNHFHKNIRLDPALYSQPGAICSVTISTKNRQAVFSNSEIASVVLEVLKAHAAKTQAPVYGYCLMPDHVHLVLGPSPQCSIIDFVGQFKNLSLRVMWRQGIKGSIWQLSFWDHFLRTDEQLEQVVQYVLNNPVRRRLVNHWKEYGFSGSLVFDLEKWSM
jgi:putative transposase